MEKHTLWSLRLGYSAKQAKAIEKVGLKKFLENSFSTKVDTKFPDFLEDSPKTLAEFKENRKKIRTNPEQTKETLKKEGLLEREGTKGGVWILHYINPKVGE